MKFKILFVLSLALLSASSFALSIGASPGKIDLGIMEKGQEKLVQLTIFSDTENEVAVNIKTLSIVEDYYNANFKSNEMIWDPYQASQESIGSWITFVDNPIILKPHEFETKTTYPSYITSAKNISLIIKIPEDAEPGYHSIRLSFDADIKNEGTGAKALAITSVDIPIVLKVDGEAVRSGYISGFDFSDNRLNINFYNNGTTTLFVKPEELKISKDGNVVETLVASSVLSKPKTTTKMSRSAEDLLPGKYEIYARAVWTTGNSEKTANIFIDSSVPDNTTAGKPIPLNINITTIIIAIAVVVAAIGAAIFIRR